MTEAIKAGSALEVQQPPLSRVELLKMAAAGIAVRDLFGYIIPSHPEGLQRVVLHESFRQVGDNPLSIETVTEVIHAGLTVGHDVAALPEIVYLGIGEVDREMIDAMMAKE